MKLVEFGSLCKLQNGRAFKPTEWREHGIPIIRIQNLNDFNKPFNYCDEEIDNRFHVNDNDLLFSWSGTPGTSFGAFFWTRGKAYLNQHIFNVKVDERVSSKNYIRYAINSKLQIIIDQAHGGVGLKHITKGKLESIKIPLLSLKEQQKIAEILDSADALRQKDQQLIDHYTALSQSLFLDMFGDPAINPKGWNKKTLKECGSVSTGNTPPRAKSQYYGDYIEWIKTNNINTPNMYLTKAEEYLSEEGSMIGRIVNENSLLVTCIAGSKKVIGNVAIAGRTVAFNQQINSFTPKEGNTLFFYFMFIIGQKHIQSFSTNGMKGMINKSKFESIDFIYPPITDQNIFAERVEIIEKQKQQAQASLEQSNNLFNSLLQKAFTGELTSKRSH